MTTRYVNPAFTPDSTHFTTIQAAVDAGSVPGDSILISPGIYRENVVIPKSAPFKSPNDDLDNSAGLKLVIKPAESGNVVIKGSNLISGSVWTQASAGELGFAQPSGAKIYKYTGGDPGINVQQIFMYPSSVDPNDPLQANNLGVNIWKLGYPSNYTFNYKLGAYFPLEDPTSVAPDNDTGALSLAYMAANAGISFFYVRETVTAGPVFSNRLIFLRLNDTTDPNTLKFEFSIRPRLLSMASESHADRGYGNLAVSNIILMHSSSATTSFNIPGAINSGHSSIWTGCTIQLCDCVGIGIWDFGIVQSSYLLSNGCCACGIGGRGIGQRILSNQIQRNNYRLFPDSFHSGGLKLVPDVSIEDTLNIYVIGNSIGYNNGPGIWIDGGSELNTDTPRFKYIQNNTIHNNTLSGIWIERSKNCIISGNLIISNHRNGINIDGSASCTIDGNTILYTEPLASLPGSADTSGISIYGLRLAGGSEVAEITPERSFACRDNIVSNNIIAFNHTQCQLRVTYDQTADFDVSNNTSNNNYIYKGPDGSWAGSFARVNFMLTHLTWDGSAHGNSIGFDIVDSPGVLIPTGSGLNPNVNWDSGVAGRMDQLSVLTDPSQRALNKLLNVPN